MNFEQSDYKKLAVIFFGLFFIQRFFYVAKGLPYYSLDENEIVEYAIGYLGGDFNPYWFKYGPLFSYILAGIFFIQNLFIPGTLNDFAESYFENPTSYYLTARILGQIFHLGMAFVSYKITKDFISKSAAPLSLAIGLIPFADTMTGFFARVDSLLALNFALVIYFALHFFKSNHSKWYLLTGFFIGASIATKPLPALLILPPVYFIWILSELNKLQKRKTLLLIFKQIGLSFLNTRLYGLVLFIIMGTFIFHPYSILDFNSFFNEQLNTFVSDSEAPWSKGYQISSYLNFGMPFLIVSTFSLIHSMFLFKRKNYLVLLSTVFFIFFYWLFFALKPVREYYYLPLFSILIVLNSYTIHLYYLKIKSNPYFKFLMITIFISVMGFSPIVSLINDFNNFKLNKTKILASDQKSAELWVLKNIPINSKILYYGYYTSLPRLIDPNPEEQAQYGDYFMYQRWKNKFLISRFNGFMNNYLISNKPTYDIVYNLNFNTSQGNKAYYTRYDIGEDEQFLYQVCKQSQIQYIITDNDLYRFNYMNQYQIWPSIEDPQTQTSIRVYKIF